ncbi:G-protein coupled receptor GRL101 [Elysia marginata]|uniref:G-protein coupled receptor GRL101 n=1 Tax=Elysia marginata TaxID=1093978 RepID=A0AAV4GYN2_9GAST|nr:G-protein coupled receptor GRL101 [Elysia marginata]
METYFHCVRPTCPGTSAQSCGPGYFYCSEGRCLPDKYRCDFALDCEMGEDEENCTTAHACADDEFRCSGGQCIPMSKRCDLIKDCVDWTDEVNCGHMTCPGGSRRCQSGQCIPEPWWCDYHPDCLDVSDEADCEYHNFQRACTEDEFTCDSGQCIPKSLVCFSDRDLSHKRLSCNDNSHLVNCSKLMSNNKIRLNTTTMSQEAFDSVIYLDLSNNSLMEIPPECFDTLWRITYLSLSNNSLTSLGNIFTRQTSLTQLYLNGNKIRTIQQGTFESLIHLTALDLSNQELTHLYKNMFKGLKKITILNLSGNKIHSVDDGAFNGLISLVLLDLTDNHIHQIGQKVFMGLPQLKTLKTDAHRFCCLVQASADVNCTPEPDEFSSCEDLMSNHILRISIWVLGIVALCGNFVVVFWRFMDFRGARVHSFLITNLAIGDFLMGVYLVIIAVVDTHYRGVYSIYSDQWRHSGLCKFAGFISTFSSELSVLTLTTITLDRLMCILFPLKRIKLGLKQAIIVMGLIWLIVFSIALLPLLGFQYFEVGCCKLRIVLVLLSAI